VRKHLENIFGRLGVTSRTAAVIRAFPDIAVN
jgi:DNA-binding NarL/FixJ family response regulator